MKKLNKILIVSLVILSFAAVSVTAFAFTRSNPAEIVAGLTGKSVEEVSEERYESGKTYGQIAYDEGSWEQFRDEMLKNKKAFLDEKVTEGTLTQEEADEIYSKIETMQEDCTQNGSGSGLMRKEFGNGSGFGMGNGFGNGSGRGMNGLGGCRGNRGSW